MKISARFSENRDLLLQSILEAISLQFEIVALLKIQPENGSRPKVPCKSKSSVGSDGSLAMNDLIDSSRRNTDLLGKAVL